jgi:DsbC/DsbD-like thiol-disulfide interchange protein
MAMALSVGLCAVLGLGTTGCGKKTKTTTTATTSPTTTTTTTTTTTATAPSLSLSVEDLSIEQGKSGTAKITVTRTNVSKDEVISLSFSGVPEGVTIADSKIDKDKTEASSEVTVGKDVEPKNYTIKVTGTAGKVKSEEASLKLTVTKKAAEAKPSLSLSVADLSVEQGKKGTAKITVTRTNVSKDEVVSLSFSGLPEGVTIADSKIDKDKTEATSEVSVKDTVEPKTYTVKVTGTAGKVKSDEAALKLTVTKKAAAAPSNRVYLAAADLVIIQAGNYEVVISGVSNTRQEPAVK